MKEQTNDLALKGLTDKKFELSNLIDKLESEGKDAHLIEVRLERVKNDINSIIKN